MLDGDITDDDMYYITPEKHSILLKGHVKSGDVLITTRGNIGQVAIVPDRHEDSNINAQIVLLRSNQETLYNRYLLWALQSRSAIEQYLALQTGTALKQLPVGKLEQLKIKVTDIVEQHRISENLDKLYEIIKARRTEIELLDTLIKARFAELFGEQERNPFGFKKETIGDCCTLKSGTSLPAEKENEGGNIPYVKVGDMNYPGNERYITTSSRYVTEETAGKGLFEVGTVIFPKRGGAIGTNKKRMTTVPICADLNVMGVSSKGEVLPEYLLAYFDDIDMGALSDGSSVPQINNKNIAPLTILIPPIELQREFVRFIKQVDKSKVVA